MRACVVVQRRSRIGRIHYDEHYEPSIFIYFYLGRRDVSHKASAVTDETDRTERKKQEERLRKARHGCMQ